MLCVGARLPFAEAQVLEVTCSTTGTGGVLCWAGVPICVLLFATRSTAVLLQDLFLLLLVSGDGLYLLGGAIERVLGPFSRFMCCGNFNTLI